jgi:pimeloyl-ACP methyl ester carboxylesterase
VTHAYREFVYRSADGLALFCREYRAAEAEGTIVCLPGLTRNSRDFAEIAAHLAERYHVLTPDLRGRGRSAWDPEPSHYQPTAYFQDVLTLLTQEAREPVAVIGTSLGGILAMALAATAPDRIAGIVLNDVGPEIAPAGLARIGQYVGVRSPPGTWDAAVAQFRANYGAAYPDLDAAGWLTFARACYREDENGAVVADYDPAIGDMLRAAAPKAFDLWPGWATIAKPVLAIRGATSDILSEATFERMLREKPGLIRMEVANRGHAPLLNEPGVLPRIDSFLAGIFA